MDDLGFFSDIGENVPCDPGVRALDAKALWIRQRIGDSTSRTDRLYHSRTGA